MIVFSYSGAPSGRGLDHKLYGLSEVGNVPGGVWVVLVLEWGSRTLQGSPNPTPHSLILFFYYFFGFCGSTGAFCIMIAWQQASLCNAEHLFGAINKI